MPDVLVYIANASLLFAGISFLLFIGLVMWRFVIHFPTQRQLARRSVLKRYIFQCLEGHLNIFDVRQRLSKQDLSLMGSMIAELAESVGGGTRDEMIRILNTIDADKYYLDRLTDGTLNERLEAAHKLALFPVGQSVVALSAALNDPNIEVRVEAAESLNILGALPPMLDLAQALLSDGHGRKAVVRAFFKYLAKKHSMSIAEVLKDDSILDAEGRSALLNAIGGGNSYSVLPVLIQYTQRKYTMGERICALRALGILKHSEGAKAVRMALHDPAWEVATQAATAAGRIGDAKAIPLLVFQLFNENWWVRFRAAEALFEMGPQGIAAMEVIKNKSPEAEEFLQHLDVVMVQS